MPNRIETLKIKNIPNLSYGCLNAQNPGMLLYNQILIFEKGGIIPFIKNRLANPINAKNKVNLLFLFFNKQIKEIKKMEKPTTVNNGV